MAVFARPELASTGSSVCIRRLEAALHTREESLITSDPTERPWLFSQRPPKSPFSLRLTIQVLTADYRYLFAPPQPGGKGKKSTFGAAERHPAYYAEEQMYDARADPAEKLELIVELGLRDAIPKNASAAGALASLQRLLQQSLSQLTWNASCAALKGW